MIYTVLLCHNYSGFPPHFEPIIINAIRQYREIEQQTLILSRCTIALMIIGQQHAKIQPIPNPYWKIE